jgi:hypothetical protein
MAIWSIDVIRGGCSCISLVGRYIIGSTNFRTSEKNSISHHNSFLSTADLAARAATAALKTQPAQTNKTQRIKSTCIAESLFQPVRCHGQQNELHYNERGHSSMEDSTKLN